MKYDLEGVRVRMNFMSKEHRVLIVDDHKEVRTTFRANLEALEADLEVVDVPSGEEAILEAAGDRIDLMIADVGLPGLSGLELLETIKTRNPHTKIILVTGLEDEDIRREVADAGTEAFFIKPVRIPELLQTVKRSLGLKEEPQEPDPPPLEVDLLGEDISERIADLRGELGAISIVLLSRKGKIAAKSGGLPDAVYESHVMAELLDTYHSVNVISSFLNQDQPRSQWYFSGEKYDLFWSHVGQSFGLLAVTNPILQNTDLTWVLTTINLAVRETLKLIEKADKGLAQPDQLTGADIASQVLEHSEPSGQDDDPQDEKGQEKRPVSDGEREAKEKSPPEILGERVDVKKSEADSFWERAALEDEEVENPDALTYEEARKLGFIPDKEGEGA